VKTDETSERMDLGANKTDQLIHKC